MSGYKLASRGKRRHRIRIMRPTTTNTKGSITTTWSVAAERWAWRRPARSSEVSEGSRVQGRTMSMIGFPRMDVLNTTFRIEETVQGGNRIFNIDGVQERDGDLREHVCTCYEEL